MTNAETKLNLISVHSYRGGAGRSTVAALLGLALSDTARVCVVDLDFLAPGLHHQFGRHEVEHGIMDYMIADPRSGVRAASPEDVCFPLELQFDDDQQRELYLIPGRLDLSKASSMHGYLLADHRAGMVQARLKVLLREVQQNLKIDVFVLDTAPSLFGASAMARSLVEQYQGTVVYVSTAAQYDLQDTLAAIGEPPAEGTTEVYVLNHCSTARTQRDIPQVLQTSMYGVAKSKRTALLRRFKFALLCEDEDDEVFPITPSATTFAEVAELAADLLNAVR